MRALLDEIMGPDMIGPSGPEPDARPVVQPEPALCGCPRSCVDAPGHASGFRTVRACDRVRPCVRPAVAALIMAAGRYGDTRIGGRSFLRALGLRGARCLSQPGSGRSCALTVRRPPHTPDGPGRNGMSSRITPLPPPGPGSPAVSSSWPRGRGPSCWPRQSRPASAACARACGRARILPARPCARLNAPRPLRL